MAPVEQLREALKALADEAARAVCEPRRFQTNEDHRQQRLGQAVATARLLLNEDVQLESARRDPRGISDGCGTN